MRWRLHRWCFAGVFLCALAAPAEGKVSRGPKSLSDKERAEAAAEEAIRALREGRKDDALARFDAAWSLFKDPIYMCERGKLQSDLGRADRAAQDMTLCLRLMKPEDKQLLGEKVERKLKDLRAQVGALTVETNVPDAEVLVDGKVLGSLPLADPIFLAPGKYGVEVRAPGYQPDARIALMFAGRSLRIRMRPEPTRTEVAPPPQESAPLEPKKEEKPPAPAPSPLVPEKTAAPLPAPAGVARPGAKPVRAAFILTGLGLSVVGAATAVGGLMAASSTQGKAKMQYRELTTKKIPCGSTIPDPCAEPDGTMDRAWGLTALGFAGGGVSGIGGFLVVYELVRTSGQGSATNVQAAVISSPGGGMFRLTGRF